MRSVPLFLTLSLMAPAALAQANRAIFPSNHASVEGSANHAGGPYSAGVSRMQCVYEAWDLTVPDGATIKAVGFRQDGGTPLASTGYQLQLEVVMSPTTVDAQTASGTFANNTPTPTTVYAKKVFNLPTLAVPSSRPSTTFAMVPLDTGFPYSAAQNLVVEYRVYANANGSQAFPYYIDLASGIASSQSYGTGCSTSGGTTPALTASGGVLGQGWSVLLTNGPGSQTVGFVVSGGQQNMPLPGAPGCTLLVDLSNPVVVPTTTSSGGTAGLSFGVPNNLYLHGKALYAQLAVIDPFANALGVVTSNGVNTTFGTPPRAAFIYATGSATGTTGSPAYLYSFVAAFDY